MIKFTKGNIFQSDAQVITNPVNCVGVMGKGLALAFKRKFPAMFINYQSHCRYGDLHLGKVYLTTDLERQILLFPTKAHWRDNSVLSDIELGLKYLADNHQKMGIQSIAIPPLGCGLGGLDWNKVKDLILWHLGHLETLEVTVYEP
jgi:O-acetyl-ADP-ribose deacetylase (regulator of RNase III)